MMLAILAMVLQSDGISGPPAPPPPKPVRLAPQGCRPASNGDIVVCARDDSVYRLSKLPDRYQRSDSIIPTARTRLADGSTLSAETEQADVGGFPSDRLMLRWKKGY